MILTLFYLLKPKNQTSYQSSYIRVYKGLKEYFLVNEPSHKSLIYYMCSTALDVSNTKEQYT